MPRVLVALVLLVSTMLIVALVVLSRSGGSGGGDPIEPNGGATTTALADLAPRSGLEGLVIPDFSMIRQDGELVDATIFDGHLTVLTFIFTNCQLACPPMMGVTTGVAAELQGLPVRFASISVDPVHDTPERLEKFAQDYGVDTERWQFLHGEMSEVESVLEALFFELREDTNEANDIMLASGETMSNILHPTQLLLVGPDRQVIDLYGSQIPEQIDALIELCKSIDW